MIDLARTARQAWHGIAYLEKELGRRISVRTGRALSTPQSYYVIFSGRCNVACTFCTIYTKVDPSIPGEAMLRIVSQAKELSGKGFNMSLSGGEPLIYKPLYETLEHAHKLGVDFGFTTNGYLLTKTNVAKALQFDPFNINISLESVDAKVNESVRPRRDGTKQTLDGIDNVVMEKRRTGSRVSVLVKPTIMDQNYRGLPDLVRHLSKYKEVQIHLQAYFGAGDSPFWVKDVKEFERVVNELKEMRESGFNVVVDDETLDGFVRYFATPPKSDGEYGRLKLNGEARGCDIGYRSMFIFPDGDVHFCDLLNDKVGNVHESSLSEIYYSAYAQKQRKRINYCNIDCQRTCQRPIALGTKIRAFLKMG